MDDSGNERYERMEEETSTTIEELDLKSYSTKYGKQQRNMKLLVFGYVLPTIVAGLLIACLVLLVLIKNDMSHLSQLPRPVNLADVDKLSKEFSALTATMNDAMSKIKEREETRDETETPYKTVHNSPSLLDIVKGNTDLSTFLMALKNVSLDTKLQNDGPYTVFAPTNEAFLNLPSYYSKMDPLAVMEMHLGLNTIMKSNLTDPQFNEKVFKTELSHRDLRDNQYANSAINGGFAVTISGRLITGFDNVAFNGVLHIISDVIACVYSSKSGNIPNELEKHGYGHKYTKFLQFLNETKVLLKDLKSGGPFTVFAPDDIAFSKLDPQILVHMDADPNFMMKVISFHIVANHTYFTPGIVDGLSLTTLEGSPVKFQGKGAAAKVNSATMSVVDRCANNGVFHTISQVIFPSSVQEIYDSIIANKSMNIASEETTTSTRNVVSTTVA